MMVRFSFDICFGPKLYQICKISSEGLFVHDQKQFSIYCIAYSLNFVLTTFQYPTDHNLIPCSPSDSFIIVQNKKFLTKHCPVNKTKPNRYHMCSWKSSHWVSGRGKSCLELELVWNFIMQAFARLLTPNWMNLVINAGKFIKLTTFSGQVMRSDEYIFVSQSLNDQARKVFFAVLYRAFLELICGNP